VNAFIEQAPTVAAIATILLGLVGLFLPRAAAAFTEVQPENAQGMAEVRSIFGGFFLGIGIACLWLHDPAAFATAGIASLCAALGRMFSLIVDRSITIKNVGGVFSEVILGGCFLLSQL